MHWKQKANIQNALSLLPTSASYAIYYWVQRHFGNLKTINPTGRISAAIDTWTQMQEQGINPTGKVFMEIGTGRTPLVPMAYWLMGAEKTISIDLNPYLKAELIEESIQYIYKNKEDILSLFGPLIDQTRLNKLLSLNEPKKFSLSVFLDLCQIDYIAPGDASNTNLPEQSIDFHTSFTVLEHIPLGVLIEIFKEGNRIIKNNGLFVHRVDYSDHFSHSDKNISAINFLQYSEDEWNKFADNSYMYMNRLRHDDFIELLESVKHTTLNAQTYSDKRSQELLVNDEFLLNERFRSKPEEVLAITGAWITSRKK